MKTDAVIVKQSPIHGNGVFAARNFKKGEVVLRWDTSIVLSDEEFKKLTDDQKRYVCLMEGKYVRMQEPERYVNHSCDPNTIAKQFCDIATRDINKGEEITGNYNTIAPANASISCNCGDDHCAGSFVS